MKTKTTRRAKETRTAYLTRQKRAPRDTARPPFPQARYLTRKERIALEVYKDSLLAMLPNQIENIILFGSKARGDAAPDSDVDIFVIVNGDQVNPGADDSRWTTIVHATEPIDSKYHVFISPIVRNVEQTRKWSPLLDHVFKEGVNLWQRSEFPIVTWRQGDESVALSKQEHIEARMAMAREKLLSARDLVDKGHYNDAISRAYYAMFYASKALLLSLGKDPHKHSGVVSMFGEKIAKVGLTDPKYGTRLRDAKDLREDADYKEFFHATKEQAEDSIARAKDFVNEAEQILKKIQARGK